MQELRELMNQLRMENTQLRLEWAAANANSPASPSREPMLDDSAPPRGDPVPVPAARGQSIERLVFVPRDRKCPSFRGGSGMTLEWEEEVRACMRARHLSVADQAFFIYDNLEGAAREEIKYCPAAERNDPEKVLKILHNYMGVTNPMCLYRKHFSEKTTTGESLLEFSLALMRLMEKVNQTAPHEVLNAEVMLRDQFVKHVYDGSLCRELKQLVWRQPTVTLLDVHSKALRWERERMPGGTRGRSQSTSSAYGYQCIVSGESHNARSSQGSEMAELKEILKQQQQGQLDQLTQNMAALQACQKQGRPPGVNPITCNRCLKPGHYARECDGE